LSDKRGNLRHLGGDFSSPWGRVGRYTGKTRIVTMEGRGHRGSNDSTSSPRETGIWYVWKKDAAAPKSECHTREIEWKKGWFWQWSDGGKKNKGFMGGGRGDTQTPGLQQQRGKKGEKMDEQNQISLWWRASKRSAKSQNRLQKSSQVAKPQPGDVKFNSASRPRSKALQQRPGNKQGWGATGEGGGQKAPPARKCSRKRKEGVVRKCTLNS